MFILTNEEFSLKIFLFTSRYFWNTIFFNRYLEDSGGTSWLFSSPAATPYPGSTPPPPHTSHYTNLPSHQESHGIFSSPPSVTLAGSHHHHQHYNDGSRLGSSGNSSLLNFSPADMGGSMVSFSSDPSLLGNSGGMKLDGGEGSPVGYHLPLNSLTPTSSNDPDSGLQMFHTDRGGMQTPHHSNQPQPLKMDYSYPPSLTSYTTLQPSNSSIPISPSFITPDIVTKQEAFIDSSQQLAGQ